MRLFGFTDHPDKLVQASNKIALLLASNTPFYPLYLYFVLGRDGLPWLWLPLVSLPFFSATFWIAKRNGTASRAWLCGVSILNSLFVTWLLGETSGTELFLIPCIALAVMSFRKQEYVPMAIFAGLPYVLYFFLYKHFPAAPKRYTPDEYASLIRLSAFSVMSVSAALAYIFSGARGDPEPPVSG